MITVWKLKALGLIIGFCLGLATMGCIAMIIWLRKSKPKKQYGMRTNRHDATNGMTRDEWDAYCQAEEAGDVEAIRVIMQAKEMREKKQ